MSTGTAPAIELTDVARHYGAVHAVDKVSFSVRPGEFFAMLGPSGSGKTTCLRLIAGFEQPSRGTVRLAGTDMTGVPPYERDVNTVFQDYALFPHLNVLDNIAYGLRMKGVDATERRRRAQEALELVALEPFGGRRPSQLSGGQRQRVALARAVVNRPKVLLLDEPLGALDLRLREQMQTELKRLHRKLGISFVYVTHDQGEAMSMADRVAVFSNGRLEQVDSPQTLYQHPATSFVAEFVGGSNVLRGDLAQSVGGRAGQPVAVRSEHLRVLSVQALVPDGHRVLSGVVSDLSFHGATTRIEVRVGAQSVHAALTNQEDGGLELPELGETVQVSWPTAATVQLQA